MDKKQDLIYHLIFGEDTAFLIDLGEFVEDIYQYDDFVADIRSILRKSKVTIAKSTIRVDSKTAMWELNIKK